MTSFLSCELPELPKVAPRATKLKMSVYTPRTIINHKSLPERPFPGGSNGYSTIKGYGGVHLETLFFETSTD